MMNKTIKTGAVEVIKPKVNPATFDFPVHTRFLANGTVYVVRKAVRDGNVDFRHLYSDNNEEIMMLDTVRSIALEAPDFLIMA